MCQFCLIAETAFLTMAFRKQNSRVLALAEIACVEILGNPGVDITICCDTQKEEDSLRNTIKDLMEQAAGQPLLEDYK
jgi:hypothetical protein